jgi:hypothetical protein
MDALYLLSVGAATLASGILALMGVERLTRRFR